MVDTVSVKSTIEERLRKLKEQERKLRQQEQKSSDRKTLDIGKLAVKAGISDIEPDILYGAFVDIANKKNDEKCVALWIKNSSKKSVFNEGSGTKVSISFEVVPSKIIRDQLKKTGLKWNDFRGEFYGICERSVVEKILQNIEYKIETF